MVEGGQAQGSLGCELADDQVDGGEAGNCTNSALGGGAEGTSDPNACMVLGASELV